MNDREEAIERSSERLVGVEEENSAADPQERCDRVANADATEIAKRRQLHDDLECVQGVEHESLSS